MSVSPLPPDDSVELTREEISQLHDKIVANWQGRVSAQGIGNPTSKAYLTAQGHFFSGAMMGLTAMGLRHNDAMPVRWVMSIMRGAPITSPKDQSQS